MNIFTPYLAWGESMLEIHSPEELDQVINQLIEQGQKKMPLSVQLVANEESALLITVGSQESHVEFYSITEPVLVVGCKGPWDDNSLVAFTHGGEYSEIERRYCVPFASAREALNQYFLTGQRPNNIQWNDDLDE